MRKLGWLRLPLIVTLVFLYVPIVVLVLIAIIGFRLPLAWIVLGLGALSWGLAVLCIRRQQART